MTEDIKIRLEILDLAIQVYDSKNATRTISHIAEEMWQWLTRPPKKFRMFISLVTEQDAPPPPPYFLEITNMADSINLTDTQQVTVAIEADDSKGYPVTDELTWTSDTPDVVGLTVAGDSASALFVAGKPGSATVTVTDGTITDIIAVTVTTGSVAAFKATIGTPEEQPSSTPDTPPADTVTTDPPSDGTVPGPGASGEILPPAQVG